VPGLIIYRYDVPLCFANAQDFRRRALAAVDYNDGFVEWFVLNAEANVEVDLTALDALDQLRDELSQRESCSRWRGSNKTFVSPLPRPDCSRGWARTGSA
jgi:MFS superfamily sulfate permease-like transporter